MFIKTIKGAMSAALLSTLCSTSLFANSDEEIVKSIMKLRAEVESLYTQVDENKEGYKAEMKSLAMQSADNKAQINRQNTSIKLAKLELEKIKTKIAATSSENEDLMPLLEKGSILVKQAIEEGIPFKTSERLAAVDEIHSKLKEGLITQEKALQLLWASFDDNLRMTKEIGLFKQQVTVGGKTVLAKIAKVGSVMMYFATPDEKVGYVVRSNDGFDYKVVTDEIAVAEIVNLFDALQKQIRTGYFTLPNALVLMENK